MGKPLGWGFSCQVRVTAVGAGAAATLLGGLGSGSVVAEAIGVMGAAIPSSIATIP